MNKPFNYLKLPPEREKMSDKLEALRSCEIRMNTAIRYHPESFEAMRLHHIFDEMWGSLSHAERKTYREYMGVNHSAPVPDVPEEGEAERSI